MLEEKLIKGGEVISKASKQEALLKKTEQELREREQQELKLARELAEKEELNLQLEEHFSSLQEEVEVKTKKLKKLWGKYQAATREVQDLQEEFQVIHERRTRERVACIQYEYDMGRALAVLFDVGNVYGLC